MYSLQLEYRIRLHPRWSVAAFVSGGEVAPETRQYFSSFHASAGGGVRFKPLKKNPTIIRLDYGKGVGNNSGIYFGINEAF
jgi:outer membrane translocation and assembly module TamA